MLGFISRARRPFYRFDIEIADRRAHRKPTNWKKSLRDHRS